MVRLVVPLALLPTLGCGAALRPATPDPGAVIAPELLERLAGADASRRFVVLVDLTEKADLAKAVREAAGRSGLRESRRQAVIAALEGVAGRQQARLRPLLDRLEAGGAVTYVKPVAIVNRIVVEGTAAAIGELARSRDVARILPEWTSERGHGASVESGLPPERPAWGDTFRSWAVDAMKAGRLWDAGLDGTGRVVASIDTGALEAHEQLRGRRLPGSRGWLDPIDGSPAASDSHGHGTAVLSQAVGGNPAGRIVGIAPGARWASALGNWKNYYSRVRMTLAADWVLREARPDVLVNAWSHDEGDCNEFDRPFIDAWKASGIFVVFPAGNAGPGEATGESPAQLAGVFPGGGPVFSVAALARTGSVHAISSRGPSRCGSPAFPSLAAPGAELPTASSSGPREYLSGDGTSLSSGLVGGAAALLLQADPDLMPEDLERILLDSAADVAPPGRDDASGAGRVDLERALALVRERRRP